MEDNNLYHMVGRLEGKLDAALSGVIRVEESQAQLERRVSKLESLKDATAGTLKGAITTGRIAWVVGTAVLTFVITHADRLFP